jgi:Tfp pilus assembly protein PilE
MNKRTQGFTMLDVMIVCAIIGLLAGIAFPSFAKARNTSRRTSCVNNLRQISHAKENAAMSRGWGDATDCEAAAQKAAVNEYLKNGTPTCPAGGTYTYSTLAADPQCTSSGHTI